MKPVLIIGCGDIGQRVAQLCQQRGTPVYGLARSAESADHLQEQHITPVSGDLTRPESLKDVPTRNAEIFYFAPPPPEGTTDPRMRNFLAAINQEALPCKIVLISTTAVYGDCHGAWITEEQPVNPQTDRGRRRLDAEKTCQAWAKENGVPLVILRVGGIYGPGRLPVARLQIGLPILQEKESPYTNRIHQDDLADICVVAANHVKTGKYSEAIYNVSDGQPGTMSQYFKDVAKACGLPLPPEVTREEAQQQMTAGMLSYLRESRRIDNSKLISELRITLRYPTLEDGLRNCEFENSN